MNFLVIMADEHNRNALGAYGHPVIKTPNLDALAARGVRFTNAYCNSPICVPSRASFATGRYPHDIESWDNAAPYVGAQASWAHRVRDAGHRAVSIGKLHYRNEQDDTGFEEQRIAMHVMDGVGDLRGNLLREPQPLRRLARSKLVDHVGAGESEYNRYDTAIAQEAVTFLRTQAPAKKEPWAAFVSFTAPHFPLIAPQKFIDMYPPESVVFPKQYKLGERPMHPVLQALRVAFDVADEFDELTVRRAVGAYYALCTFVDEQVGRVLQALEDSGAAEDTVVIYTSDHGDQIGEHGLWWKYTMYEGSVGVPLIASGPSLPEGTTVDTLVSLVDVYPTACEVFGLPVRAEERLRGTSLLPIARGESSPERAIFSEYHAMGSVTGSFMLRDGRYKLVYYAGYPPQLFDLESDPDELNDLASDPAYAATLVAYERRLRAIADPDDLDRRARESQLHRLEQAGGWDAVDAIGDRFAFSPAPEQFRDPVPTA